MTEENKKLETSLKIINQSLGKVAPQMAEITKQIFSIENNDDLTLIYVLIIANAMNDLHSLYGKDELELTLRQLMRQIDMEQEPSNNFTMQ